MKTILIMAGGTGGHVYPALSVAKSLMNHGIGAVSYTHLTLPTIYSV